MSLDREPWREPTLALVRELGEPAPVHPPARRKDNRAASARFTLRLASELALRTSGAWCIKHVLPAQGFGLLYGPSTSGKSLVALDLAAHVAAGEPWNGYKVERGAVVYVALEGAPDAEHRLIALREHHGLADDAPVLFIADPLNLADAGDAKSGRASDAQELARLIAEKAQELHEPVRLVIIDTLARASGGLNENDAADMGVIIETAEMVARDLSCLALLVHHAPWDASRPRGSSALYAAADVVLGVKREGEGPQSARRLGVEKLKAGADGAQWCFTLDPVVLGDDDDGEAITSCVVAWSDAPSTPMREPTLTDKQKIAMRAFRNVAARGTIKYRDDIGRGHEAITWEAWKEEMQALGASSAKDAKDRDRGARSLRDSLVNKHFVCFRDGFAWLPDGEGNTGNEREFSSVFPAREGKEGKAT